MKRTILLLLSITSVISSIYAQKDWDKLGLKGMPKSMKYIDYNVVEKFGEITKTAVKEGIKYNFDSDGYMTLKQNYGEKGTPINQISFEYNERHSPIKEDLKDSQGKLIQRTINEYNSINKLTFKSVYQSNGALLRKSAYSYISRYKLDKIITYDNYGHESNIQEYTYPKRKKYIEITTINPKSKVRSKMERLDLYNNIIESSDYDVVGNLKSKFMFTYEDGKLVKSHYFVGEKLVTDRSLRYNDKGFLIEEKLVYPLKDIKEVYTYTYDYDQYANWTKRTKHVNAVPIEVIEREFVYN